ncbi:hypothetical protein MJT46_008798 [Ovis ammon polii x Ovis aries]|nr:hypothetical protein MJT46_008798 [Ovis ammon polii x Ovis aries]
MKASAKSHLAKRLGDLPWKVRGKAKRVPNNSIYERRVTLLMSKRSAICVLLRTAQCLFQNVELCCEVENSSIIKDVLTYPMPFSSALYCVYPLLMGSSSGSRYLLKHNVLADKPCGNGVRAFKIVPAVMDYPLQGHHIKPRNTDDSLENKRPGYSYSKASPFPLVFPLLSYLSALKNGELSRSKSCRRYFPVHGRQEERFRFSKDASHQRVMIETPAYKDDVGRHQKSAHGIRH